MIGEVFGRLAVIEKAESKKYIGKKPISMSRWVCQCECGNQPTVFGRALRSGATKSCGCWRKDHPNYFLHGHTRRGKPSRTYHTWNSMKQRCSDPSIPNWHNYGGRGIKVCKRWLDFRNFLADMGEKPVGLTLERNDNERGYSPSNCRWATYKEQHRNSRQTHKITYKGKTLCVTDWAILLHIDRNVLFNRLRRGWTIDRLFAPRVFKRKL